MMPFALFHKSFAGQATDSVNATGTIDFYTGWPLNMTQIIVNHDLANAIQQASGAIELRNQQGELLGYVSRVSPVDLAKSEIAEAIERANSDGPWYTTAEVQKHLEQLERQ